MTSARKSLLTLGCRMLMVILATGISVMLAAAPASAASASPGWVLSSVAQPTDFSTGDNLLCAREHFSFCDRYVVTLTNVGNAPAGGPENSPVVIADTLPVGLRAIGMTGGNLEEGLRQESNGGFWSCRLADTTCTYSGQADPGTTLVVYVEVEVTTASGPVTNAVRVSGGGAPAVSSDEPLTLPNTVNTGLAPFGLSAFGFEAHDERGLLDSRAGDHPFGVTSTVNFNTALTADPNGGLIPGSVQPPKDIAVYLPLGFLGDPTAAAQCTEAQLGAGGSLSTECPPASRVGTFVLFEENIVSGTMVPAIFGGGESAVYNMRPQGGYPAQFGFKIAGISVPLYASLAHTSAGYVLRVAAPGLPTTLHVEGAALTFFGDPNSANGEANASHAFFTNSFNCSAGPLTAKVQADSWEAPGDWASAVSVSDPQITNCNLLQFEPAIELRPEVTQAEAPSGYEIKIKVPQTPERFPVLATPQLKDVTMTLPEGMTIAPGGGDGLVGCEATGPHGIDMPNGGSTPTDVGGDAPGERGEELGQEGMTQLIAGHCPQASQVGTVQIITPVLKNPLEGHLYIAQPKCGGPGQAACTGADAENGNLFGLYLEAGSEELGSVVKLAGSASVNQSTGRLTARFLENPQLPVSEIALQLKGGPRAPLANPRQCGAVSANAELSSWSSPVTPDAQVDSPPFVVDWDGGGSACPATLPFAPGLLAGPVSVQAGHFSSFTVTASRGDRQQDVSRLQIRMPRGLLGMISKVPLCEEPAAGQGTCGEASSIGSVHVAAGSGSHPLWVSGKAYLTGPYAGAPFGLSVVIPAVAGPFNLGNVVVRSRIDIDPVTSAVIITSDPLPQVRDGVPLRIQTLNVTVDRAGFIFNPTHCTGLQVDATIEAEQGASASLTSPVSLEGCKSLPFKPSFKASTAAATSKQLGASLDVKVNSSAGQANIAGVAVKLPKQLPARLSTLQHACLAAVFASNPAMCDPSSLVGVVTAKTPVLPVALSGPAYLVSHGGAAFPDLVVILQGDGVRIDLTGNTNIVKGITSSTFASIPDAPVESFELRLPQGPHSALTSNVRSLCGQKLAMPTTITGQNGSQIKQSTAIAVTGCPKATVKKKKKVLRATRRAKGRGALARRRA